MKHNTLAIIGDSQSISFQNLTKIINSTANYYLQNGINPNERVALLSNNSIEYVVTIYALWRINVIPIPINTRLKENEVFEILKSADCSVIIKSSKFAKMLPSFSSIAIKIDNNNNLLDYKNTTNPNDTAVVIYTSGSSGKPKGVEITNSNLYQSYLSEAKAFGFTSKDSFLLSLPLYHIGGFAIMNRALLSGGTLVLPKSLKQDDIVKAMEKKNPTVVSLVPTMLKRMLEAEIKPNGNLLHLFLGGGPSSDELIISALKNNWRVIKVYGASETTAMITECSGNELEKYPSAAGKPLANVKIEIWNEVREKLRANEVGEIVVKSTAIAKGYLNNLSTWQEKFYDGFYLTGDYGYLDSGGRLFVLSRRTDLIVSGGENINPREVEKTLLKHSQINEAVVIPLKNNEWGEIPVAAIVLNKKGTLNEIELTKYLKEKISSYKIPKRILFVENIPKTELGKIMFDEVKKLF